MNKKLMLLSLFSISVCLAAEEPELRSGKEIYQSACIACHQEATAPLFKAPAAHDSEAWATRIEQAKERIGSTKLEDAIKELSSSVKRGKGVMPAGGACDKCEQEEYIAAIEYMSAKKDKNQ